MNILHVLSYPFSFSLNHFGCLPILNIYLFIYLCILTITYAFKISYEYLTIYRMLIKSSSDFVIFNRIYISIHSALFQTIVLQNLISIGFQLRSKKSKIFGSYLLLIF